ncbi:MAG: DNA mismatch repair endonuclease MutL [Ignavibacteria bacterium]|nr:DNA mismatch repair endonuclease MutL [Ignavibacteria bacterium]
MNSSKIRILPEHLANKIAAGEVIQRPASVVKELLENSLDAGARNLVLVIGDGGKKLVKLVDDGVGLDENDAVSSFLRHATSKIATYEDLEGIETYGFRGEAIPSIAAVGRVIMKTRRFDDEVAAVVQVDGGGGPRLSKEGREPGTSVIVQNLFYNVPARRKFLKSSNTEFRHIYEVVQRVAISHPEITLQFISDDDTILDLKPGTLEQRLLDIFGDRRVEGMVWIEERSDYLSVSGYIGKPTFGQKSRVNQYLFLNRRYIVNRNINHAVFSAYENLLIKGAYPFFLLFIDIDPHRVDVNVHPSKLEAKFEDEQQIYRFVSSLVRKSLAEHDLVPAASLSEQGIEKGTVGLRFTSGQHGWPASGDFAGKVDAATGEILPSAQGTLPIEKAFHGQFLDGTELADRLLRPGDEPLGHTTPQPSEGPGETLRPKEGAHSEVGSAQLMWQVHNKYILSQIENGLMIIDQHVAHERILYERALQRFETNMHSAQQLLFPRTVQLTPGDYVLLTELLPYFEQLGFVIKQFGKNTIVIEGVPPDVKQESELKVVEDILADYKEHQQHSQLDARDNLAKSFSCKAAIKAGDRLTEQEMRSLVSQLFETKMPYVCPHGRPIVLKVSVAELDRRFGRT